MSELANNEQQQKRGWARPGGAHDKLVRTLKIVLPALIGVVLAFLFFAPLEDKQEVSFLLDKHKVDTAEERLKLTQVTYRGQDKPVPTAAVINYLVTHSGVSDDLAYQMTKQVFENLPDLASAHAAAKEITLAGASKGSPVPLHPGAERYYREKGLLK